VNKAIKTKLDNMHKTGEVTDGCYDALVFNKIRNVLGGNVTKMFTASAPLSIEVFDFLKICMCC